MAVGCHCNNTLGKKTKGQVCRKCINKKTETTDINGKVIDDLRILMQDEITFLKEELRNKESLIQRLLNELFDRNKKSENFINSEFKLTSILRGYVYVGVPPQLEQRVYYEVR